MKKTLVTIIAIISLVLCSVACDTDNKNENYDKAVSLMNQRNYEEAITSFKELGDYNDSHDKVIEVYNKMIDEYLSVEAIDKAVDAAVQLESFAGKETSNPTTYLIAQTCIKTANYESAINLLERLDGYQDSTDLLNSTKLLYGRQLCDNGQVDKALGICNAEDLLTEDEKYIVETLYDGLEPNSYFTGARVISASESKSIFGNEADITIAVWGVFSAFDRYGAGNKEAIGCIERYMVRDSAGQPMKTKGWGYLATIGENTSMRSTKTLIEMGSDSQINVDLLNQVLHRKHEEWNSMNDAERNAVLADSNNWSNRWIN